MTLPMILLHFVSSFISGRNTFMLYYFLHLYCRIKLQSNSGSETCFPTRSLSVNDAEKQLASKPSDSKNHLFFLTILWVGCEFHGWFCLRSFMWLFSWHVNGARRSDVAWLPCLAVGAGCRPRCPAFLHMASCPPNTRPFCSMLGQDSVPLGQKQKLRRLLNLRFQDFHSITSGAFYFSVKARHRASLYWSSGGTHFTFRWEQLQNTVAVSPVCHRILVSLFTQRVDD